MLCCLGTQQAPLPLVLLPPAAAGLVGPGAAAAEALCEGVVALVLKPAVLGGYERAAELAAWAQLHGLHAVVSSAFETSLGIAQLAQLAAAVDGGAPGGGGGPMHHGLATQSWFDQDLLPAAAAQLLLQPGPSGGDGGSASIQGMGISMAAAEAVVSSGTALALGLDAQQAPEQAPRQRAQRRRCHVATSSGSYHFSLLEVLPPVAAASPAGGAGHQPPVLLLHGFLGAAGDWLPVMHALGLERRCVALDLPGHGASTVLTPSHGPASNGNGATSNGSNGTAAAAAAEAGDPQAAHSLEAAAEAVAALVEREGLQGCLLVGYSLGARLALLLAARWPHLFSGVASVSGVCCVVLCGRGAGHVCELASCLPAATAALRGRHGDRPRVPSSLLLPTCNPLRHNHFCVLCPPDSFLQALRACRVQQSVRSAPRGTMRLPPRCATAAWTASCMTGTSCRCGSSCGPALASRPCWRSGGAAATPANWRRCWRQPPPAVRPACGRSCRRRRRAAACPRCCWWLAGRTPSMWVWQRGWPQSCG